MEKRLYRSRTDRTVFGVCGGLAKYFGLDPTLIRLAVALLAVCYGVGIGVYLISAIVIPNEPEVQEKTEV